MKLACTSRSFATALDSGDLTQLEVIDLASRELDIDGIVLDVRHFPRTDDDYLAQIKKMATDLGLTIAAIECDDFFSAGKQRSDEVLAIAAAVGAPLVSAPLSTEAALSWSTQLTYLSDAAGTAKSRNVTLAVRNAPGTFASSVADCKRASKETDSAWLRFALDPAAFDASGDVTGLADRAVLLWSAASADADAVVGAWGSFRGFLCVDGLDAGIPEIKNAIRRWRIALATHILNRT